MPIRQITPMSEVTDYLDRRIAALEEALVYNFEVIGERVVERVRSAGNYTDRTGNLRSSTGYVVVKDGRVVRWSDFRSVKGGSDGSADGKDFAAGLARRFSAGIVLVVVAGMRYAYYVKKRGYDVIDSGELLADTLVPKLLKDLGVRVR